MTTLHRELTKERIKKLMEEKGVQNEEFITLMGINSTALHQFFKDDRPLTQGVCFAICFFMELSVNEAIEFMMCTDFGFSENRYLDIIFFKYLRNHNYRLKDFVHEIVSDTEEKNVNRKATNKKSLKLDPFFQDEKNYTNISYSDCIDSSGMYMQSIGRTKKKMETIL